MLGFYLLRGSVHLFWRLGWTLLRWTLRSRSGRSGSFLPGSEFLLRLITSVAKRNFLSSTTEWNPALICGRSSQHRLSTPRSPAARLRSTTAPPWGPVHMCRGGRADEASELAEVVSVAAVSERSHVLLSLIYKGEPQLCVDQWQLRRGEMWNSSGPQEHSAQGPAGSMWESVRGAGEGRTIRNVTELFGVWTAANTTGLNRVVFPTLSCFPKISAAFKCCGKSYYTTVKAQ